MSNAEGVSLPRLLGQGIAVVLALAAAAMVVVVPLDLESQVLFGVLGFGVALVLGRFRGPKVDLLLIVMSLVISTRYIHWRITMTLPEEWSFDLLFGGLLLMAELYAFAVLFLGYFQTARPFRRRPVPLPSDPSTWPVVDIFIPTYNEPLKVVRATALAAKAIDWPADKLRVYILDDGGRDTGWKTDAHRQRARERNRAFSVFCREAGIYYVTRPDNSHAKAGNLNHALAKTSGEFIAIFDCDHVPTRSFLQMTMGWMLREPQLALLQTPHHFYSADPVEKNLGRFRKLPNEGELFYGLIQPGNDLWDATFFCGSCAVIRRAPLEEVGGIAVETVTEDAHTALKMQRRGWSTAYLDVPQAAGLATESLSAHVGQRIRWARGMAQIFRTDNPVLGRGLRWHQRLCYTSAMLYFFYGVPRLVFLLAPLSFLVFDLQILNATPYLVLAYAFPHLLHSITTNSRLQGRFRASLWSEVYEVILATYIILPTTLALIAPKLGSFNVTAKGSVVDRDWFDGKIARPYLVLALINAVGIGFGLYRAYAGHPNVDVIGFNIAWCTYNLIILFAAVAVAWETRQRRDNHRVEMRLPALLRARGRAMSTQTLDIALGGVGVTAPADLDIAVGESVAIALDVDGDYVSAQARVASLGSGRLGLAFDGLDIEAETGIVRAGFSRASSWTSWTDGRPEDRPLRSLGQVSSHAAGAALRLAGSAFRRSPEASS